MATRLETILINVRDTLSDPDKDRWSNDRLLRLANAAHLYIAVRTNMIKVKTDIPLFSGEAECILPSSIHKITRILNEDGSKIDVMSHQQADELYGVDWESDVGSPVKAIIFDRVQSSILKVYPIPDLVAQATAEMAQINADYGITVAGGLESTFDQLSSVYGVVTGVTQISINAVTIYYIKTPTLISKVTALLETNPLYDLAMKFYITGMALRDDKDTQNRALGKEELQFFASEMNMAKIESSKDFTAMAKQYDSPYVGGV